MNCPLRNEETSHILLDYSAHRLDATEAAALEDHIEKCPNCAAFREEQAIVIDTLDAWLPSPVSLDFNRRLWHRIDAADAAPWHKRLVESLRFTNWKPVLPLTAAILLIAAGFLFDHPGAGPVVPSTTSASSVSVSEADQVEQTLDDLQLLHQFNTAVSPGNPKTM